MKTEINRKFVMSKDNGTGAEILHRINEDGSTSFAILEDVEKIIKQAREYERASFTKAKDNYCCCEEGRMCGSCMAYYDAINDYGLDF